MSRFPFRPLWLLALALVGTTALAHRPADQAMHGPVAVELVDRASGQALPSAHRRGQTWVGGHPGDSYAVRLRNRGPERVLVVLSVDGINAISGQTADPRQAGYVLEPWQSADITGWRKSLQAVAGFVFVDPKDSYAARTGRPDNVGVVGIAVHRERERIHDAAAIRPHVQRPPRAPMQAPEPASARGPGVQAQSAEIAAAAAPAQRQRIGTGHGAIVHESTWSTHFDRDPRPVQVTELRYDTPAALSARGIRLPRRAIATTFDAPRAFPGGFVPDP